MATNPCVSVLYHCGTELATGQGPRQMVGSSQRNTAPTTQAKSSPNPPQSLPRVESGQGQMLWILDIRMEKFTVNLDRKKTPIWPYSYHIAHIIQSFVFLCMYVSYREICVCVSNNAVKSQSASPSEYLHLITRYHYRAIAFSNRGCSRLERIRWLESLIYRSRTNMHTWSQ